MAHFVQEKCLDLVPVWTIVRENKLLPKNDLRGIIGKIRELEENVQSQHRQLRDLVTLIDYVVLVTQRLEAAVKALGKHSLRKPIKDRLLATVGSRFESGIHQYGTEVDFWRYWIGVYLKLRWYDSLTDVYNKSNQILGPTNPELWIEASFFPLRFKGRAGIGDCRRIIQECLRTHSKNPKVFIAWFELELRYQSMVEGDVAKKILTPEDVRHKTSFLQQVYIAALEQLQGKSTKYYIDLFRLVSEIKIKDVNLLTTQFKRDMLKNCPNSEDTYTFLALINLEPTYSGSIQNLDNIAKCFDTFRQGTKMVPTQKMFERFIAAHYKILEQNAHFGVIQYSVKNNLKSLYVEAHQHNFLSVKDYHDWIQLLRKEKGNPKPYDTEGNWVSLAVYIENQVSEDAPKLSKLAKMDENGHDSKTELNIGDVIDLALTKYETELTIVYEKMLWELPDPTETPDEFYKMEDKAEVMLKFLKDHVVNVKFMDDGEIIIWREVYTRFISMAGWSKVPELIIMAKNKRSIQNRLIEEYLTMLYSKGAEGRKWREKFFKKLIKFNKEAMDKDLIEFVKNMDELFRINNDFENGMVGSGLEEQGHSSRRSNWNGSSVSCG